MLEHPDRPASPREFKSLLLPPMPLPEPGSLPRGSSARHTAGPAEEAVVPSETPRVGQPGAGRGLEPPPAVPPKPASPEPPGRSDRPLGRDHGSKLARARARGRRGSARTSWGRATSPGRRPLRARLRNGHRRLPPSRASCAHRASAGPEGVKGTSPLGLPVHLTVGPRAARSRRRNRARAELLSERNHEGPDLPGQGSFGPPPRPAPSPERPTSAPSQVLGCHLLPLGCACP